MKCRQCGHDNPKNSKFCRNCGKSLAIKISCDHCGKELKPDSKFCIYCGSKVQRNVTGNTARTTIRKKGIPAKKNIPEKTGTWKTAVMILTAIVFLGAGGLVIQYLTSASKSSVLDISQIPPSAPVLNNVWPVEVQKIATKFNCPCGSCDDRLDVCTCDQSGGAVEAKTYIKTLFQEGISENDIMDRVEKRYGHRI